MHARRFSRCVALLCFALSVCVCVCGVISKLQLQLMSTVIEPLLPMVPAVLAPVPVAVMPAVVSARRPENCHWPRGTELIKYLVHVQVDPGSTTVDDSAQRRLLRLPNSSPVLCTVVTFVSMVYPVTLCNAAVHTVASTSCMPRHWQCFRDISSKCQ